MTRGQERLVALLVVAVAIGFIVVIAESVLPVLHAVVRGLGS